MQSGLVLGGDALVLTMDETQATGVRDGAEGRQQIGGIEAGHAVSGAGEDLEKRDASLPEGLHLIAAVRPGVGSQAVVNQRTSAQVVDFVAEVGGRADRIAMRMFD